MTPVQFRVEKTPPNRSNGRVPIQGFTSRVWVMGLVLMATCLSVLSETPRQWNLQFEGESEKRVSEARKLMEDGARLFEKYLQKPAVCESVAVRFVSTPKPGGIRCLFVSQQGACWFDAQENTWRITIAQERSATWQRIFSHEVIHIFLNEAFGSIENQVLSEGMAEFLSAEQFPSEVRGAHRRWDSKFPPSELKPYVEGNSFCQFHANRPGFARFFEEEIKRPTADGAGLRKNWKEFGLRIKQVHHHVEDRKSKEAAR
jgi:hypothetical protein